MCGTVWYICEDELIQKEERSETTLSSFRQGQHEGKIGTENNKQNRLASEKNLGSLSCLLEEWTVTKKCN